jgi:oligopeptide transport system permease protein
MLIRNREYNVMSRVLGTNPFKMIVRNILPKIAPVIVSIGAFVIPDAISLDTSLSYLKFGFVDGTTTTSLGYLIQATITHTT